MATNYLDNLKRRLPRLRDARDHCRLLLEPFRRNRMELQKQYVGRRYSDDGATKPVVVNLLKLFTGIVLRHLVATNPRCMLGVIDPQHKPAIASLEAYVNRLAEKIQLDETLRTCAMDGLFCMGIAAVGLTDPTNIETNYKGKVGDPFVDSIDFDDWAHDMGAKTLHHAGWLGHRFRAPLDAIKSSKRYKNAHLLQPTSTAHNEQGDERIGTLSQGVRSDQEEYEDHADLWQFYLRRENAIVTMADRDGPDDFLAVEPWIGPECGPFHFLQFNLVSGNSMPSSPLSDLVELHEMTNAIYRKLRDQALRQKRNTVVRDEALGNTIKKAMDGDIIIGNPADLVQIDSGGVNQEAMMFGVHARSLFSYLAGGMDGFGGLSPQAPTLGQEQMLAQSSSRILNEMQQRTVNFARGVMGALCWYGWHNPFDTYRVSKPIAGISGASVVSLLSPQERLTPFEEIGVDIDPYSMSNDSPATRLAAINQLMTQVLIPMAPMLQQEGHRINIENWLKKNGHYSNMPDLNELVEFSGGMETQQGGGGVAENQTDMPQSTTRNYVRESRSTRTGQGNDAVLMQALAGKGVQDSEAEGLMGG